MMRKGFFAPGASFCAPPGGLKTARTGTGLDICPGKTNNDGDDPPAARPEDPPRRGRERKKRHMTYPELYKPGYEDLWFRRDMLSDDATMSYNHAWGGTIPFPEEDWRPWYDCWLADREDRHFYRYLRDEGGTFVGETAYHVDRDSGRALADVLIAARYRGRGYGGRALELLCDAARENGITVLYDNIAIDNPAIGMFLKHGFYEESRTDEVIWLRKDL